MRTLVQELRYGLRILRKNPGFTAVAVLSLALGIGANTAIFSLVNVVMLKMLPVTHPEDLVLLMWASPKAPELYHGYSGWGGCPDKPGLYSGCSFSYPTFEEIRAQNAVFSGVLAVAGLGQVNVVVNNQAGLAEAEPVSGDYFAVLGVKPLLGRPLTAEDDKPGAGPVTAISYGFWKRRFGLDPAVLGKIITLNGSPFTIIGVLPARFFGVQPGWAFDLWIPLATLPKTGSFLSASDFKQRDNWWVVVIGRLKRGVSEVQARAAVDVIFRRSIGPLVKPNADPPTIPSIALYSSSRGLEMLRQQLSKPLFILLTVAGLVLLIACVNVANLLLARSSARQGEIAVRLALGAGRGRLVRQMLTESVLLAMCGGAASLVLAHWMTRLLVNLITSSGWPLMLEVSPDARVLGFTATASLLTGILFGVAPALRGTRLDLTLGLKSGARNVAGAAGQGRRMGLGRGLVVLQVAVSLLLLVGAGLFVRTLANLRNVKLGFDPQQIVLFGLDLTQIGDKDQRRAGFYRELLERLETLPGVRSVSLSQDALISGSIVKSDISIEGYTPASGEDMGLWILRVGPQFFETMGIPVLLGRSIVRGDTQSTRQVAVINQVLARRFWHDESPVGRRFGGEDKKKGYDTEIVGVVGDAKYDDLRQKAPPTAYVPFDLAEKNPGRVHFEVRATGNPKDLISTVRRLVAQMDNRLPLFDVKTQSQQIDESLFQERMFAELTSGFGLVALALACIGLYGVLSYTVLRRTNEIGIRMALGAQRGDILGMVMREVLFMVAVGALLGLGAALAATRLVSGLLFGLTPTDPFTLVAATLLLLSVAAFAGWVPAQRASHVDPMVALRNE